MAVGDAGDVAETIGVRGRLNNNNNIAAREYVIGKANNCDVRV